MRKLPDELYSLFSLKVEGLYRKKICIRGYISYGHMGVWIAMQALVIGLVLFVAAMLLNAIVPYLPEFNFQKQIDRNKLAIEKMKREDEEAKSLPDYSDTVKDTLGLKLTHMSERVMDEFGVKK